MHHAYATNFVMQFCVKHWLDIYNQLFEIVANYQQHASQGMQLIMFYHSRISGTMASKIYTHLKHSLQLAPDLLATEKHYQINNYATEPLLLWSGYWMLHDVIHMFTTLCV